MSCESNPGRPDGGAGTPETDKTDKTDFGPDRVTERPTADLKPSPENDDIYMPVRPDDPAVRGLADSIAAHGVKEPLVVSADGFVLSGHRRLCAAKLAGLATVPVRVEPVRRDGDRDGFARLLREYNRQREKTRAERVREAVLDADPDEPYRALLAAREEEAAGTADAPALDLGAVKGRKKISDAKAPMLAACGAVLEANRRYWPLSVRAVHYRLLNDPPLRHASKPRSTYRNDLKSYKDLTNLLTRARLSGAIPMHALADETRPVSTWRVFTGPSGFVEAELRRMLKGYRRDLMQSQSAHVEILAEKNTVKPIAERVAGRYGIPVTTGRGYCSVPPRAELAARFDASGKRRLVLLVVSDLDPEGEDIAQSFGRSMRDDFGLDPHVVKVALTPAQARELNLPPGGTVKPGSSKAKNYIAAHGTTDVWELEALEPAKLAELLAAAIDSVIDRAAFNAEREAERADAAFLDGVRYDAHEAIAEAADLYDDGEDE